MSLLPKHRKFNYKPRHQNDASESLQDDFKSKWQEIKPRAKRKSIFTSPIYLVLFLILVIVLMYVLGRYE